MLNTSSNECGCIACNGLDVIGSHHFWARGIYSQCIHIDSTLKYWPMLNTSNKCGCIACNDLDVMGSHHF